MQVLFSSVASLLGSAGQANYSAANAALDAMAMAQAQSGVPGVVSIQWGAWAGGGMASHDVQTALRVERLGIGLISSETGLGALASVLSQNLVLGRANPVTAAVPITWDKFLQKQFGAVVPPFFSAVGSVPEPPAAGLARGNNLTGEIYEGRPAEAVGSASVVKINVLAEVNAALKDVLGLETGPDDALMASGVDSLASVELRAELESRFGLQLPATLAFDYPTPAALASFILEALPDISPGAAAASVDLRLLEAPAVGPAHGTATGIALASFSAQIPQGLLQSHIYLFVLLLRQRISGSAVQIA